jgi:hypothetical protein
MHHRAQHGKLRLPAELWCSSCCSPCRCCLMLLLLLSMVLLLLLLLRPLLLLLLLFAGTLAVPGSKLPPAPGIPQAPRRRVRYGSPRPACGQRASAASASGPTRSTPHMVASRTAVPTPSRRGLLRAAPSSARRSVQRGALLQMIN